MSSALFDKLQTEFAGAEVVARIAVNQTPADARAEWNSGLLIGAPEPRPAAPSVLYALELEGKLLCMRRSGLRHTINAGTYGCAIAFTSLHGLIVFCVQHGGNKLVRGAVVKPLTPAEFIQRGEHTVHLMLDGEGKDIRTGNALAYAALTPEQRKTGYGYDVAHGNRRAA